MSQSERKLWKRVRRKIEWRWNEFCYYSRVAVVGVGDRRMNTDTTLKFGTKYTDAAHGNTNLTAAQSGTERVTESSSNRKKKAERNRERERTANDAPDGYRLTESRHTTSSPF